MNVSGNEMAKVLNLWAESSECITVAQLDRFKLNHPNIPYSHHEPWKQLREVTAALPIDLE